MMTTETQPLNILISGSGIAGPCLAFWLHKLIPTCRITVLERSPTPRHGGQAVDLRSFSVPIVSRMGLLDQVRSKTTTEVGLQFVYADGITRATFPASGNIEAQSATSEFEVLRGDLARILMNATQSLDGITYVFDDMVESISQTGAPDNKVDVTFAHGLPPATYDLVVGADGMMSRTRRLVFGREHQHDESVRRLGQYAALFTMPRMDSDTKFAQCPISGVGAGSAIVGAYVLAGEVSRSQDDIPNALEQYEKVLRPYVEKAQRLIPGAPQIANPQTEWGVWTFNKLTGIASSAIMKHLGGLVGNFLPAFGGTANFPFPDYEVTST
ncbi:hypothetical protein SLS61_008030 [Didymella pomorum]